MDSDLDTLLIALYVALTDHVLPSPGFASNEVDQDAVTDAELLCLAVAQVQLRFGRERHWLRVVPKLVGHLFPRLPSQLRYNRLLRKLGNVLASALRWLADQCPGSADVVRLLGGTKIICGMSRETVKHSNLYGYCGYGYDASHTLYFWGAKLLLDVTADGLVTGFALANPKLHGERETVLMMQRRPAHAMAPGTTAVADKGFRSAPFEAELLDQGIVLVRPAMQGEHDPGVLPKRLRQRVESAISTLKGQLGIEHPGAHEPDGLFARVAQRLLALNTVIWHNWNIAAPRGRSLIAYDHVRA